MKKRIIFSTFAMFANHTFAAEVPSDNYKKCVNFFVNNSSYSNEIMKSYCAKKASPEFSQAIENFSTPFPVWHEIQVVGNFVTQKSSSPAPTYERDVVLSLVDLPLDAKNFDAFKQTSMKNILQFHAFFMGTSDWLYSGVPFDDRLAVVESVEELIKAAPANYKSSPDWSPANYQKHLYRCGLNLYQTKAGSIVAEGRDSSGNFGKSLVIHPQYKSNRSGRYYSPIEAIKACGEIGVDLVECGIDYNYIQDQSRANDFATLLNVCHSNFKIPGKVDVWLKMESQNLTEPLQKSLSPNISSSSSLTSGNNLPALQQSGAPTSGSYKASASPSSPATKSVQTSSVKQPVKKTDFELLWLKYANLSENTLESAEIVKKIFLYLEKEWQFASAHNPSAYDDRNRQIVPYFVFVKNNVASLPPTQLVNFKIDIQNNFDSIFGKPERRRLFGNRAIDARNKARLDIRMVINSF